jgi:hypothetical protein
MINSRDSEVCYKLIISRTLLETVSTITMNGNLLLWEVGYGHSYQNWSL